MAKKTWKLRPGATWRQKLESTHPSHGKIVNVPPRMQARFGKGTMLIPRPIDVDAAMRRVRKGKLMTQSQLRDILAKAAGADSACPLTTGIFVRIAAEAAEEDRRAGKKRITPYWRTIKDDGSLNEKFPGGAEAQAANLRQEGLDIRAGKAGKKLRVSDFMSHLIT